MNARIQRFCLALVVEIALLGAARHAVAQPPPDQAKVDEAKAHYRRARELYDENNFRGALVEMQRAYELSQNPKLLYDLGQISYQLQDYPAALSAFTKYLALNKGDIPQQRVDDVQKDIDRLKTRIG